jgi:hypothetical protein
MPAKDPSPVMAQILQNLVEEARKVGSIAEMDVSGMSQQAPVGTTLALLERNLKVMSGVQARLHASMQKELRLIADIIGSTEGNYEYDEQPYNRSEDFAAVGKDIIPVSDPNASMMAQRVVQYQAGMELAYKSPDLYNMPLFHQQMLGCWASRKPTRSSSCRKTPSRWILFRKIWLFSMAYLPKHSSIRTIRLTCRSIWRWFRTRPS